MYGERDDPYAVLSRLGRRLEAAIAPEAVLPTIVETVAQSLRLPYAAITLRQEGIFTTVAEYGQGGGAPAGEVMRLPLTYQGEMVGQLVLSPRAAGETFGAADRRLLDDLARQAGGAAHAAGLTQALQALARAAGDGACRAKSQETFEKPRGVQSSAGPPRRSFLRWLWRRLASSRCSFTPRGTRVAVRGVGGTAARRSTATRRSSASSRLRAWVR